MHAKWLGIEGSKNLRLGVSACATCDGFKNKSVVVVGGGNTGRRSDFLSNICKQVTLIHRRNSLRADKILQDRLFDKDNIQVIWNHELKKIIGDSKKEYSTNSNKNVDNQNENTVKLDGLFIAIGHKPATEIFLKKLEIDEDGYIFNES